MKEQRFDEVWRKIITASAGITKHGGLVEDHVKWFRRDAYRFAEGVLLARKHFDAEFHQMVESTGVSVVDWINAHFGPIEAMGDNRERLFAAIESGVTEKEYVAQGEIAIINKRVCAGKLAGSVAGDPLPAPSKANMTAEETAEDFRERWQIVVSQNAGLRHELARYKKDLAIALRRLEQLERSIQRIKKQVDPVLAA